jgi:hypothetical protein
MSDDQTSRPDVPGGDPTINLGQVTPEGQPIPTAEPDLHRELAAAGGRISRPTLALAGLAVLVVGFLGGILTHRAYAGSAGTTGNAEQQAAGRNGYAFGGPARVRPSGFPRGNRAGGFGGGTVGTVDHISGGTVYVKTAAGKTVPVTVSGSTTIRITKDGKVTDLAKGQTVVVLGSTGSDGSVAARSITEGQRMPGTRTAPRTN